MEFWLNSKDISIRLPITPPSFEINIGNNISTVNVINTGDINIVGNRKLSIVKLTFTIPKNEYNFAYPSTIGTTEPYAYTAHFLNFLNNKDIIQFIVTDTPVNLSCVVEDFTYSEVDGTRDLEITLNLRQYRKQSVGKTTSFKDNRPRDATITTTIETDNKTKDKTKDNKKSKNKTSSGSYNKNGSVYIYKPGTNKNGTTSKATPSTKSKTTTKYKGATIK